MNSTYKQCNLTDKGSIQSRSAKSNTEIIKVDKFGVRFEGVIFPLAITMISEYIRELFKLKTNVNRADILLKSEEASQSLNHLSILKQVILNSDSKDYKILLE